MRSARTIGVMKNPGTAAVLSAILPGLGQFYNGDFLRGIFWLIITPGLWIGSGGSRLDLSRHRRDDGPPTRKDQESEPGVTGGSEGAETGSARRSTRVHRTSS